MTSSPRSTNEFERSLSSRSLSSVGERLQPAINGRPHQHGARPSGSLPVSQFARRATSLVSRKASFASINSDDNQGHSSPKEQAQMFKHIISIISFMRSRANSNEADHKKSQLNQSESSGKTNIARDDDNDSESDEIPWFGATEAAILASRAAVSAPACAKETEPDLEDVTDEGSDDYVAFQSSNKRRRLRSVFERRERMYESTTLESFDEEALEMDVNDIYQLLNLLEASSANPSFIKRRVSRRMPKFSISTSSRSLFKRH